MVSAKDQSMTKDQLLQDEHTFWMKTPYCIPYRDVGLRISYNKHKARCCSCQTRRCRPQLGVQARPSSLEGLETTGFQKESLEPIYSAMNKTKDAFPRTCESPNLRACTRPEQFSSWKKIKIMSISEQNVKLPIVREEHKAWWWPFQGRRPKCTFSE